MAEASLTVWGKGGRSHDVQRACKKTFYTLLLSDADADTMLQIE